MPADQMYHMLIKVLRDSDRAQGYEFLRRFLMGPQECADATAARIRLLSTTDSPTTIRSDLLQYLKDHVGFTRELDGITLRLDDPALRKLLRLAVPMWRQKGTDQGVASMAQFFTGRMPALDSWFTFRFILGENQLGWDGGTADGWNIGGQSSTMDEYISRLAVMDDGTLDERLLLDLLQLTRPGGEYIEVAVLDFLDRFTGPKDRWSSTGDAVAVIDADALELVLPEGCQEQAIIPNASSVLAREMAFQHRFKLSSATSRHGARWNVTSTGYYELEVNTTDIIIRRFQDDAQVFFTSVPALGVPRVAGVWYGLRLESYSSDDAYVLKVYLDGDKVIEATDADGYGWRPSGDFQLLNLQPTGNGTGDNRVDAVEVWHHPLRFATIAPSGITITDNFIS